MKQARQLLMLAICAAFSISLSAQAPVYEVNLASITEVNVTLNENCEALLIPSMVLTGDFDVDDDGISPADSNLFSIVVEDSNPANGPIIDECGRFVYRVEAMDQTIVTPAVEGFTGAFAEDNWEAVLFGTPADGTTFTTEFTDETLTLTTQGVPGSFFGTRFEFGTSFTFSEAGDFTFTFDYNGADDGGVFVFDAAFAVYDFEGEDEEFIVATQSAVTGTETVTVTAGKTIEITISQDGADSFNGEGVFIISDISFDPIDVVTPVTGFTTQWGYVNAEDKTAPTVLEDADDVNLLCVDIDANDLTTLGNTVDRCYLVNASTGATVPGSMSPALRARLLAGGTAPRVPLFTDGCADQIEVCVLDAVQRDAEDPACNDVVITRTFTATEVAICPSASGENNPSVSSSYTLTFERPTLDDLDTSNIEPVVNVETCGVAPGDVADFPAPRAGDFPFLDVDGRIFNLAAGDAVCNIGVTFENGPAIVTCPFTYKFVRTYTVIDWCTPEDVRTFTQVVKVGDTTAPTFTGPNRPTNADGDLVFGTNAGNICAAFLRLDDVSAVDVCSGTNVTISASIFPGGDLTGDPIGAFTVVPGGTPELSTAIPVGRHLLRYTFADQCGNSDFEDFFFVVEDQTPPVAICEDGLNISIGGSNNDGFAVLTPDNIDAGSYDDCSGITRSIARVGANDLPLAGQSYGPQVIVDCDDLGTVRVSLRVEDALGNVNFCWLNVLVEDKRAPTCVAPGPTSITCNDYNETLPANIADLNTVAGFAQLDALFGQAAGVDNCGTTVTQTVSGDINSCGVGSILRTFVSTDGTGFVNTNNCQQFIEVLGVHDYRITFPVDVEGECEVIPSFDGVSAEEFGCDLITTTRDVDTLRTQLAGEECFKLRITYDVVNWCEYNSLGEPIVIRRDAFGAVNRRRQARDNDARLTSDVVYVNVLPNTVDDGNPNTDDNDDDTAFVTLNTDRNINTGSNQRDFVLAGYGTSDSRGFFRYTQFVKIYDEVAPEITFTAPTDCFVGDDANCAAAIEIEFEARDECSDATVTVELDPFYNAAAGFQADAATAAALGVAVDTDGEGNFTVTASGVPAGTHALRVSASDGCGNFDNQIIVFCVEANRTPTPICIQTLTVVLADDGNNGGIAAIWGSDFIASPIVDCIGNEVTKYSLYRADDANATIENARFNPPSTNGIDDIDCDDFANGTVRVRLFAFDDQGSDPNFCEVVVEVQDNAGYCGDSDGDLAGIITNDNDEALAGVQVNITGGMSTTVMTDDNGNFRFSGLTQGADYTVQPTFDAPVNLRNVKTSDLTYMIGNILGTSNFDSPYDYVAADVNEDGILNIFDVIATSQTILGIEAGFAGGNWVFVSADATIDMNNPYGVAFPEVYNVNDLEGSIRGVGFIGVELGNPFHGGGRSAQAINLEDAQLEAGQLHTIVLDGSALAGFQGTIELAAGLELVAADFVGEGGLNLNNAAEGLVAIAVRDNATVTLEVRATEAGLLSDLVSLTDAITVREGVTLDGNSNSLALNFAGVAAGELVNGLGQNSPNPVADVTRVPFTLAAASQVTLSVQDVQGRTVMVRSIEGVQGQNVALVNVADLNGAAGVLSYTLTAGDFTATKKMVVVR